MNNTIPQEIKDKIAIYAKENATVIEAEKRSTERELKFAAQLGYSLALPEIAALKRLLHDLTPGGSEFYNDPVRCAEWVKENRTSTHYAMGETIKSLKAEVERLNNDLEKQRAITNEVLLKAYQAAFNAWLQTQPAFSGKQIEQESGYKETFNPDWKGDPDDENRWKGW